MVVYYIVFFITLVLSYFLPCDTDEQWKKKLFWTFLPLFLFGALRVDFGNDYDAYEMFFNELHNQSHFVYDKEHHAEFGYQLLNYILPSFRAVLVFNSLLLCIALAVFIYRNVPRKYLWLAVILIFLNVEKNIYGSLVGTRNGLAVSIFLLSTVLIQKRKIIPYAVTTIIAMSFHSSAIFFMPIAYVAGMTKEISKKEIIVWCSVILIFMVSAQTILQSYIAPFLVDEYESYTLYLYDEYHRGFLLTITGMVTLFLIICLFRENNSSLSNDQKSLIRLGFLYPISSILGSITMRAGYFYDMFFIATVVSLISYSDKRNRYAKLLCALTIISSIYSFYSWRSNNIGNIRYDIYQSVFSFL